MPRRIGNGEQLGIDGSGTVGSRLPKGLPNPFRDGYALSAGHSLNLSVFFLIEEDLKLLWHPNSVCGSLLNESMVPSSD